MRRAILWLLTPFVYTAIRLLLGETEGLQLAIDPATIAILAGSLIGAGGNIAGGILSQDSEAGRVSDLLTAQTRPRTDPVLSAISLESLLGLGSDQLLDVLRTASPKQQLLTQILENPTIKNKTKRRLISDLETALAGGEIGGSKARTKRLDEALSLGGFSSLEALRTAESQFQTQTQSTVNELAPISEAVRAGRISALEGISALQQDFPLVTEDRFNQVLDQQRNVLRDQVNQQANVLGINPATKLAQTEVAALDRALSLLSGQQALGTQGIAGLQQSLIPSQQLGLATSGQRTSSQQAASQLAGQQALAINQLSSNAALQNAQSLGTGIAAGFGSLGQGISLLGQPSTGESLAQTIQLLNQLDKSPAEETE